MQTYYYILASQRFLLEEEPLEEVLKERTRNYHEQEKEIDFWLVKQPAFLEAPEMAQIKQECPQPAVAIISTNPQFITRLKLRLEFVITGEFQAPSETIPDPIASLASVSWPQWVLRCRWLLLNSIKTLHQKSTKLLVVGCVLHTNAKISFSSSGRQYTPTVIENGTRCQSTTSLLGVV